MVERVLDPHIHNVPFMFSAFYRLLNRGIFYPTTTDKAHRITRTKPVDNVIGVAAHPLARRFMNHSECEVQMGFRSRGPPLGRYRRRSGRPRHPGRRHRPT